MTTAVSNYGKFQQSHQCNVFHTWFFVLLGAGLAVSGPIGWLVSTEDKELFKVFSIVAGITGLLLIYLGWRNSRTCLDLYARGMVFTRAGGGWECAYSDVAQVFHRFGTVEGVIVVLKDGKTRRALMIGGSLRAAKFIASKIGDANHPDA